MSEKLDGSRTQTTERTTAKEAADIGMEDAATDMGKAAMASANMGDQDPLQQQASCSSDILGLGLDKGGRDIAKYKEQLGITEVAGVHTTIPTPSVPVPTTIATIPAAALVGTATLPPTAATATAVAAMSWTKETNAMVKAYNEASQLTYVNAKQYERILHRRETRAILDAHYAKLREAQGNKKRNTPYTHLSRHEHSKKRLRNSKGKFLTKDEIAEYFKKNPDKAPTPVSEEVKEETNEKPSSQHC